MKTGMFVKVFDRFDKGLWELMNISFSAKQAICSHGNPMELAADSHAIFDETMFNLAMNVAHDRPSNPKDWNSCSIQITSFGFVYKTQAGLEFGCKVDPTNFQSNLEWKGDVAGNHWTFWFVHPKGAAMDDKSQLAANAQKYGWKEPVTIGEFQLDWSVADAIRSGKVQIGVCVNQLNDPEGTDWCHVVVAPGWESAVKHKPEFERLSTNVEGYAVFFVNHADFRAIVAKFTNDYFVTTAEIFAE